MTPTIRRLLDRVRRRERLLALSRRAAWGVAAGAGLFAVACLVDFLVDFRQETPWPLRVALVAAQVAVWGVALAAMAHALLRRRSDEALTALVEEKVPALRGRLAAAARGEGESAEQLAGQVLAEQVCPGRPFRAAALLLAAAAVALVSLTLAQPDVMTALVARAALLDGDIPRDVALHPVNGEVWPVGEEGVLRFVVTGELPDPSAVGTVHLYPQGQGPIPLELCYEEPSIWSARVPALEAPFTYAAWLGPARLRTLGKMDYEPRPVVRSLRAAVVLPGKPSGPRPGGGPPEVAQRSGDIEFRDAGSKARVLVISQIAIAAGFVSVRGERPRLVRLHPEKEHGKAEFDLLPGDQSYSVHVFSRYGFDNLNPPSHAIRKLPAAP